MELIICVPKKNGEDLQSIMAACRKEFGFLTFRLMDFKKISETEKQFLFSWSLKFISKSPKTKDKIAYQAAKMYFLAVFCWATNIYPDFVIDSFETTSIRIPREDIQGIIDRHADLYTAGRPSVSLSKREKMFICPFKAEFEKIASKKGFYAACSEAWSRL